MTLSVRAGEIKGRHAVETAGVYIPMDRRQAIAAGLDLPRRTEGAALFADISGFTPLTEGLARTLGPQRGAEELTRTLNLVYDALTAEVDRYHGTVIGFSGDAITCWFDGDDAVRATTCALAMQQAMSAFTALPLPDGRTVALAMKVAIALGPVRRFLVGDPDILTVDVMAGATLDHLAAAEHQAAKGEVVLDEAAALALGDRAHVVEWRVDEHDGERFAVVDRLVQSAPPSPWPALAPDALGESQVRPWVFPPVFERAWSGQGEFLAELRPCVALFLRFLGIDYDHDPQAEVKLDRYVRWVEGILAHYDGYLIQLTIGDKGSYLYAAFGAPVAHGDDPRRAAAAALELRAIPPDLDYIQPVQMGITRGRMRTGPYGGQTRRTYGVLGDATNLSARLMQNAQPGQILVTEAIGDAIDDWFAVESLPAIKVKGKSDPIGIFALVGPRPPQAATGQEVAYALPMVGRQAELALIESKLQQARAGQGQLLGITAEAGMGKSRLLAEVGRLAAEAGFLGFSGAAQSYGTNNSYLVWEPIWQAFFGVDPEAPIEVSVQILADHLAAIDPLLVSRLPLLGLALELPIPDNDLTRSFDAKLRKSSLEALLVDCLRARARSGAPLLLVLEDSHWMDPLSHDLLEVVGRAIADLPVVIALAYRPPDVQRLEAPRAALLPHFTEVPLKDFTPEEAERLIRLKLEQLTGSEQAVSAEFVERLTARAQGNPFYIEELLNYLQDKGIQPDDTKALASLDLPTSLHSLILSRIDQLNERQKITVRVASVIGRLFRFAWLWGVYPDLGNADRVKADLDDLHRLDLTPLDQPEPELVYMFKHIVTQEVAYESLLSSTRAVFHGQFGQFIEQVYADHLSQYLDLLAYHYYRSPNDDKKREYLRRAGEAAQAAYANDAAIDYYQRLIPLLPPEPQIDVMLKLGQVLELVGQWEPANEVYERGLALAEQTGHRSAQARCQAAIGDVRSKRGLYAEAVEWLGRARASFEVLEDWVGMAQALKLAGTVAARQGDLTMADRLYSEGLALSRLSKDQRTIAFLLSNLGMVARYQSDLATAKARYEESLGILRQLGDRWAMSTVLGNLGYVLRDLGDDNAALPILEESLSIRKQVGDKWLIGNSLNQLGEFALDRGDTAAARAMYREALTLYSELGDPRAIATLLEDFGGLATTQGQPKRALLLAGAAYTLRSAIMAPLPPLEQTRLDRRLAPAREALGEVEATTIWEAGRQMTLEEAIAFALNTNI